MINLDRTDLYINYFFRSAIMEKQPLFDECLYNRRITIHAGFAQQYMLTMIFIRHVITGEHFVTFETATKALFPVRDEEDRRLVSRVLLKELDGSEKTLTVATKLSQTIMKIPRCLTESLVCLTTKNLLPTQLIDMFCAELLYLLNDAHVLGASRNLMGFLATLLLTTRELYEAANFYRVEEFLFISHKFLFELEFLYLIVTYYLDFAHEQLSYLNRGDFLACDVPDQLSAIREKIDSLVDSPIHKFQNLVSAASVILPTYDL